MSQQVLAGCEPFALEGGSTGVLMVHGFTGNPTSMREWGADLAERGYAVDCPRLPGHGTTWQDLAGRTASEWVEETDSALTRLRGSCSDVVVAALSFGGALALDLAARRGHEIRGLVLVNPYVRDRRHVLLPAASLFLRSVAGTGNDIKKMGANELSYERIPLRAVREVSRLMKAVRSALPVISIPILVFHSGDDHVIPGDNGPFVIEHVGSEDKELVTLADSYHVATLDNDAPMIFERTAGFVERVTAA